MTTRVADRGSATIWVAIACLVTWSVAIVALSVGGVVAARHRAASAADLAALAGAQTLAAGGGDPCVAAQRVASAARARVVSCDVAIDGSLRVVVEAALPWLLARWPHLPPARARARAGRLSRIGAWQGHGSWQSAGSTGHHRFRTCWSPPLPRSATASSGMLTKTSS
jgi:secretion/DNA translocation related TadE-like protein